MTTQSVNQNPESAMTAPSTQFRLKKRDRIAFHLCLSPLVLLCFLGVFIFLCVVIPTTGQLLFCAVALSICVFVLERCGRRLYPVLKEADATTAHRSTKKKLLGYYATFLVILIVTMVGGSYLNTHYLDVDKAAQNRTHFERIFHIDNNESSTL